MKEADCCARSAVANPHWRIFPAHSGAFSSMPASSARTFLPGTRIRLSELPQAEPRFIKKMDCLAVDDVGQIPSTSEWYREVKWDGYRVCVVKNGTRVSLRTKSNQPPGGRC